MQDEMISLPIRAAPYEHQRRAAAFALDRLDQGGGAALLMEMGTPISPSFLMMLFSDFTRLLIW